LTGQHYYPIVDGLRRFFQKQVLVHDRFHSVFNLRSLTPSIWTASQESAYAFRHPLHRGLIQVEHVTSSHNLICQILEPFHCRQRVICKVAILRIVVLDADEEEIVGL
jgi:hypothetical protein